MYKMVNIV